MNLKIETSIKKSFKIVVVDNKCKITHLAVGMADITQVEPEDLVPEKRMIKSKLLFTWD